LLPLLPLVVAPPCAHFLGGQSPTGEGRGVRPHGIGVLFLNFNLGQFLYLGRKHDRMPSVLAALVKSHMTPCIGNVQQGQSCGSEKAPDILQPGPNSFSTKTQSRLLSCGRKALRMSVACQAVVVPGRLDHYSFQKQMAE